VFSAGEERVEQKIYGWKPEHGAGISRGTEYYYCPQTNKETSYPNCG